MSVPSNVAPLAPASEFAPWATFGPEHSARPPRFDPYRMADSAPMRTLVAEVTDMALRAEAERGLRKRQRRPDDERRFRLLVEAIVCNVVYQTLRGHSAVRISRSKCELAHASRYRSEIMGKQVPAVLDLLASIGVLHQEIGHYEFNPYGESRSLQTTISAGPWLIPQIAARSIVTEDFGRRAGDELVLLKGDREAGLGELVEYFDNARTVAYREQVQTLNAHLRNADISYTGPAVNGLLVDARNRHLRRSFTYCSWERGGRLSGGFWMNLPKTERAAYIRINGQPVQHLDFKSMFATLAYAQISEAPPAGDLYAIEVNGRSIDRDVVKRLFAAALFMYSRPKRWPTGIPAPGVPVAAVLSAIEARHPALVSLLYRGIGHELMHHESEILVSALLHLTEQGITALPIHDCVVVAESDAPAAREAMLLAAEARTGAAFTITED